MSLRLAQLQTFLAATPNEPFLLFAIAKEYEGLADKENAFVYYQKLVAEHEDYVGTYYHLGKLFEKDECITEAIDTYKKGMIIAQKQNDKHAYGELNTAKMMIDDEEY